MSSSTQVLQEKYQILSKIIIRFFKRSKLHSYKHFEHSRKTHPKNRSNHTLLFQNNLKGIKKMISDIKEHHESQLEKLKNQVTKLKTQSEIKEKIKNEGYIKINTVVKKKGS